MAAMRVNPRQEITEHTKAWIAGERSTALQWADSEAEGFTFAARNEVEWLNEHMAEIFSQNQAQVNKRLGMNFTDFPNSKFADVFKTPGKLRAKTPRPARNLAAGQVREPLSDVFSSAPRGEVNPFKQTNFDRQIASFRVAEDEPVKQATVSAAKNSSPQRVIRTLDSGYHGSQSDNGTEIDDEENCEPTQRFSPDKSLSRDQAMDDENGAPARASEERRTTEGSFQSAKEEQTKSLAAVEQPEDQEMLDIEPDVEETVAYPVLASPLESRLPQSPRLPSPRKDSPQRHAAVSKSPRKIEAQDLVPAKVEEEEHLDDPQSASDGSSPIRPIVRKSSLNFASLPAREPITTKKSIGNRVSRTSHLDQTRTSYYGRPTGGKSLGNIRQNEASQDDEMDVDSVDDDEKRESGSKVTQLHNKTSTQRLQDQISMLGQSQSNTRPHSKSIASNTANASQEGQVSQVSTHEAPHKSPARTGAFNAPGAFPEDEDDSWIGPPTANAPAPFHHSPRPRIPKSQTTDVMEEIHGKDSISGAQFNIPKRGEPQRPCSPLREMAISENKSTSTLGHVKSASTSFIASPSKGVDSPGFGHKKAISVSNPNPSQSNLDDESDSPPKSPSRTRGSPLKAAKDKFSSILKTSRGLFASSAAVSADAKNAALSPPSSKMGKSTTALHDLMSSQATYTEDSLYPSLDNHAAAQPPPSPSRSVRKTRASTEKEDRRKEEEAKEAREAKEAKKLEEQLEKARAKVREDARQHHIEQERVASMEKQIAARKEQESTTKANQIDLPRATRSSPRKTKAQLEAEGIAAAAISTSSKDVEMTDATASMPPPAIPRPKPASQIGRPGPKRPVKPAKDTSSKTKAPTVIRVDTGSQRGHQYHPSNSSLSASLQDSLSGPSSSNQNTLSKKASGASLHGKTLSTSSFKTAASKALEAAARKKEQDELAAQRKRETKLELERQRAAMKEEERRQQEQQRREEAERQRELQREKEQAAAAAAEAKRAASRQAMERERKRQEMEKAKQTRAPPPAIRPQSNTDMSKDKALPPIPQAQRDPAKPNRMNTKLQRSQDDLARPIASIPHNNSKAPSKRPLQPDNEDRSSRPTLQRNAPSNHQNEGNTKRRKTSDTFDSDDIDPQPRLMAPPIRHSGVRHKVPTLTPCIVTEINQTQEMPPKSLFPSGYANAPPAASNLQRTAVITQHSINQSKPSHPMDMAQVSKAPIAFASSSSQVPNQSYKTPARPAGTAAGAKSIAKSATRSSPRYQNGELIDLPEINTDSEDDDDDDGNAFAPPGWTNSPALRTQLAIQENLDPNRIFGPPGPINMEEVFSKSGKNFRARTSSANWSGQDRLTEDEVQKDIEARDRVRRQGGWTYDTMV
ncbi:hypothetical protein BP6252_04134 [Coleophoma cylindrospora]|uniref:Inner centromere protein ARK-binding domain-containing protein n=1 Tax=Coleophoma cylindrospora TaxID=1849047 RepID=A0A3D8RZN1_9HELO|nr:hypothetical protein BP6252_04134 [Coleophoma cylindrospora]